MGASFLTLCPGRQICVIPLELPWKIFIGQQVVFLYALTKAIIFLREVNPLMDAPKLQMLYNVGLFLVACASGPILRRWNLQHEALRTRVNNFRFREARCSVESDREAVLRNITALMIDAELADDDIAIAAFEELVHSEVPEHLYRCFGRVCFPYYFHLYAYSNFLFGGLDMLGASLHEGKSLKYCCKVIFVYHLSFVFSILPNAAAATQTFLFCFSGKRSTCVEVLIVTGAAVVCTTSVFVPYAMTRTDNEMIALVVMLVSMGITVSIYVPKETFNIKRQISQISRSRSSGRSGKHTIQHSIVPIGKRESEPWVSRRPMTIQIPEQ